MISFTERKRRFASVSAPLRLAFAATCAERVLPIYEKFWIGDFHPELLRTVELAWQSVEGGNVDAEEVARCSDVSREVAELYAQESIAVLAQAANSAVWIMDMLKPAEPEDSASAAPRGYAAVLTAGQAIDAVLSRNGVASSAQAEEEAWLDAAVARAESWTGPVTRDTFRDLGAFPPKWWSAYLNAQHHY